MISIANTRQFGNNALISPNSKPNDGIFEIVMVKPFPFYYYPVFVIKMFLGTLKDSKYIRYILEKGSVTIFSDFKKYHVDGDPHTFKEQLEIRMLDAKIKVIQPAHNHRPNKKIKESMKDRFIKTNTFKTWLDCLNRLDSFFFKESFGLFVVSSENRGVYVTRVS